MEILKDIFVPYKIAVQLKEIGFDEPCIFYYDVFKKLMIQTYGTVYWHREESIKIKNYNLDVGDVINLKSAPTWEQVFKWFREKGFYGNIQTGLLSTAIKITVAPEFENEEYFREVYDNENHYEEAREQLILKLIEIYKDGKKDR